MKKYIIILITAVLLSSVSWSMIDSYAFKIMGKVIEISADAKTMKLDVLSVIPTKSDSDTWVARHYLKGKTNINMVSYAEGIDPKMVKPGTIVIGDFMAVETEVHYEGYRLHYTFKVEDIYSGKSAESYFNSRTNELKRILASGTVSAKMNVAAVAKEFDLRALDPALKQYGYGPTTTTTITTTTSTTLFSVGPKQRSLFGVGLGMSQSRADDFLGRGRFLGSVGRLNYYSYDNNKKIIGFTAIGDRGAVVIWTIDPAYNVFGVAVGDLSAKALKELGEAETISELDKTQYWNYPTRNVVVEISGQKVVRIGVYDPAKI
ncbi:MAG: hypothetical protein ABID35_06215 [Candidatus Margulisiibacteriota bacterium]